MRGTHPLLLTFPLVAPSTYTGVGSRAQTDGTYQLWNSFADGRVVTAGVVRHEGADIGCPPGTIVVAATEGVVTAARWSGLGGWAVMIEARGTLSGATYRTLYAHMLLPPFVQVGQRVPSGYTLGLSGQTGGVPAAAIGTTFPRFPHLHFSVRVDDAAWDPTNALLSLAPLRLDARAVPPTYRIPTPPTDPTVDAINSASVVLAREGQHIPKSYNRYLHP